MKALLEKLRGIRGGPWLLALLLAAACLMWPAARSREAEMTEEEQRISATLSRIAGAGKTRIAVTYAEPESAFSSARRTAVGAVVVAEGADNISVRLELARAVQTLLNLPAGAVEIFRMEAGP